MSSMKFTPCSSNVDVTVAQLFDSKILREDGERTDDMKGCNNYWAATSEISKDWRASSNRWKWTCKITRSQLSDILNELPKHFTDEEQDNFEERFRKAMQVHVDEESDNEVGDDLNVNEDQSVNKSVESTDLLREQDFTAGEKSPPPKKPRFKFGITTASKPSSETKIGGEFFKNPSSNSRCAMENDPNDLSSRHVPPLLDHRHKKGPIKKFGLPSKHTSSARGQEPNETPGFAFRTAAQQLSINQASKPQQSSYGTSNKTLGATRPAGIQNSFKPPVLNVDNDNQSSLSKAPAASLKEKTSETDERLKNIDEAMIERVKNEIMDAGSNLHWDDIAGLEFVKSVVKEVVVFPMLRPDIFRGLKAPPKGILLFGPPGTGKTLIGKCIASQSKSTFFSISASTLTSKWVGEGEKMVRALFAVARVHQPSVVFIDEIDSLLNSRSDTEHESSRRLKTEFLVQLDGATTNGDERVLVIGATNRPQDLDEAARRRLVKRLYVPLPEPEARHQIIKNLVSRESNRLTENDIEEIVKRTEGYSGADMANLCRDAAIGPIRGLDCSKIETITSSDIRPIELSDFIESLKQVRASVSDKDLAMYLDWDRTYGSGK